VDGSGRLERGATEAGRRRLADELGSAVERQPEHLTDTWYPQHAVTPARRFATHQHPVVAAMTPGSSLPMTNTAVTRLPRR
jgi:hypothetical protein